MGVFSTNQNRQMYVANAQKASVAKTDAAGTIAVKSNTAKTEMYFNYVGADKTVMRSDLIKVDNIMFPPIPPTLPAKACIAPCANAPLPSAPLKPAMPAAVTARSFTPCVIVPIPAFC